MIGSLRRCSSSSSRNSANAWTCRTILAHHPASLLSSVSSLLPQLAPPSSVAAADGNNERQTSYIFAASKNLPFSVVESVHRLLSNDGAAAVQSSCIGVLSEPLPPTFLSNGSTSTASSPVYSISIAAAASATNDRRIIPFRSTLTGRENIAVGREIQSKDRRYGKDGTKDRTVDRGFEAFLRGEQWNFGQVDAGGAGAAVTDGIQELAGIESNKVKQLICFTADRTQPFLAALENYPSATTIGLHASSTPFHSPTALPFTLLYTNEQGRLESSGIGAIGMAIVEQAGAAQSSTSRLQVLEEEKVRIDYSGLKSFDLPAEITSAKGNIVLTLSNQNAARLLLKAVQDLNSATAKREGRENAKLPNDRGSEKEVEYWAAVFEKDPGTTPDLSKSIHVSRIMAGDPSRGAMSFETEEEMRVGSWVSFLHRPSPLPVPSVLLPSFSTERSASSSTPAASAPLSPSSSSSSSFVFLSVASCLDIPTSDLPASSLSKSLLSPSDSSSTPTSSSSTSTTGRDGVTIVDGFLAASENGVVLTRLRAGKKSCWVCRTDGAAVRMD